MTTAMEDPSGSSGWRFAQCFGDKGEVEDITEGRLLHDDQDVVLTSNLSQPTSFPRSNSTLQATTLPRVTRVAESFSSSETSRSVCLSDSPRGLHYSSNLSHRKRDVNTSFTRNSNRMNQNSTISSLSRLKRKSTR